MKLIEILESSTDKTQVESQYVLDEKVGNYEHLLEQAEINYGLNSFHKIENGFLHEWYKPWEKKEEYCRVRLLFVKDDFLQKDSVITLNNGNQYEITSTKTSKGGERFYLKSVQENGVILKDSIFINDLLIISENTLNVEQLNKWKIKIT